MLTLVKLGGSLITDKRVESSFREQVMDGVAAEIASALQRNPALQLIVGHGSGSFGHFAASRYNTIAGVNTPEEWRAFAQVATVAAELNYLVARSLHKAGVPVFRVQPSASTLAHDGRLVDMALQPIKQALNHGLIPLVYGDVAFDDQRGGTITSTESVFFYLAQNLPVTRILLLGEVEGVYDLNNQVIPHINSTNFDGIEAALGGSSGKDVTGGMETKVRDMLSLTHQVEGLTIRIMDGRQPGLLEQTLLNQAHPGTLITP